MRKPKSQESPIRKRVKEICDGLLYVPAPELVNLVEENLISQIDPEMVIKAHNQIIESRKPQLQKDTPPKKPGTPSPTPTPTSTSPTPEG